MGNVNSPKNFIHYLPHPRNNSNVWCLNGSAHLERSEDIKEVTCPVCLDRSKTAKYWAGWEKNFKLSNN